MIEYVQQFLLLGPQTSTEAGDGGSYMSLGMAAAVVAVAIWRRGHRD